MDEAQVRQLIGHERDRISQLMRDREAEGLGEGEAEGMSELSSHDQHQADLGTETFEREKDFSLLEQLEAELNDLDHALRKLDQGTYGKCEACGKDIPSERLETLPGARLCVEDQARR